MSAFFAGLAGWLFVVMLAAANCIGASLIWEWHIEGWNNLPALAWQTAFAFMVLAGLLRRTQKEERDLQELLMDASAKTASFWLFVGILYILR